MELHSVHKIFHSNHLGEEKHQMLDLNRRLETYLSRVKHLEEENALLAKEIQAMRHSSHGALARRKGLEEELRQARLEVDAAWRDRVFTELEVGKLVEDLQALDLQRQREAQAQVKARTKLEQSRKELEEEQRAQVWLRQKVSQLEHEMRLLTQTHQEDVAHLEATLIHSRATVPRTLAQRANQAPNLLQLGHEYSQRATRAWQEAAEAHQGQLARLEESLSQARRDLTQVGQEKRESQLKLQALEKEIASAQDVRLHLEKTAAQQKDNHSQEILQLQEHLESLEMEREEMGQQIDHLLLENRGLMQLKMSLGLEVSTYRALLDTESLRGDTSSGNQPKNIFITDAVFSPRGPKQNYQSQLSARHKTSLSSVCGIAGPTAITATPTWSRKPATLNETPKTSGKPSDATTTQAPLEIPYPKILQDGAVENFRPQEVHEEVTYAEPLSPPNEQEAFIQTPGDKEEEEIFNNVDVEPPEKSPVIEEVVSSQVESGLSSELSFSEAVVHHQFMAPSLTPYHVRMTEESCGFSDESDKDVATEKDDMQQPPAPVEAWVEKECADREAAPVQDETSDSETEAVLEPTCESRPSSPESESMFNQGMDYNPEENILHDDAVEIKQEISCSMVGTDETEVEDKLYPDGEEMDTWDSVIERKVDLKTDDDIKNEEGKRQHAEPEEDISAKELETRQDLVRDVQPVVSPLMAPQVDDGQHSPLEEEQAPPPDQEEDDEEDSQNVSVSWKTEVESDSYAQDNTLADTRPLIRYKSDETDANTQASHMDESESSEGEQEKRIGETGTGMWSDDKSKRFGTMEDLCEDVEGEIIDEEYNLGYTHSEVRDVGGGTTVSELGTLVDDTDKAEGMVRKVSEGHSDEESEELSKPMVRPNVDYDEELESDRLVEQELENLSTDSYSIHFAQRKVSEETLQLKEKYVEEMTEQEETGIMETEDESSCDPGLRVNHELTSSTTVKDETSESLFFGESSVVMPQTDSVAEEDIQHKDQEAIDNPEKREGEDEHNVSMVTHADVTEDHYGFSDFITRSEMEEIDNSEDPNSVLLDTTNQGNLQHVAASPELKESQEHLVGDVAASQEFPEAAEWEVLENPRDDLETDQKETEQKCDHMPESAEDDTMTHQEEAIEISRDTDETNIFAVKDATDNGLRGYFDSGVMNDFWASSLDSGATVQPDDACNEAAEQTNQNLGFADNLAWATLENPNVVNGNSRVDIDSSKVLAAKKEQEPVHTEVKQVLCRNVEGELVHSEESEVEGELWSSGEELA